MIAVALSGGDDSTAAAIVLHDSGETIMGITMYLGPHNPGKASIKRAADLCEYLDIPHHLIDLSQAFDAIKDAFCMDYIHGLTPNPCIICNRDIKFRAFLDSARKLGADQIATGHFARIKTHGSRYYLCRAAQINSQEYFMGLVSQEALAKTILPLGKMTKKEVIDKVKDCAFGARPSRASQDLCFIHHKDHAAFIASRTGFRSVPGPILDTQGKIIGTHQGAIHYTIGQRKGLGTGFGKPCYVLKTDMENNTVTIGDRYGITTTGFFLSKINYMKQPCLDHPVSIMLKVRYRQRPEPARVRPTTNGLRVEYPGIFAPGQLAVAYDKDDCILFAGIIRPPESSDQKTEGHYVER
ncbi:MAG: tRNA 2-thiouridine(34) synthase MnmA [Thermodesulfobacteriota bacterium]|nr:tRNA 2-thiouridine(34) synthase MnmA [Thermodesulfobacteriota bacterium]